MKNNKKCLMQIYKMILHFFLKENLQWTTDEYLIVLTSLLLVAVWCVLSIKMLDFIEEFRCSELNTMHK